MIGIETISLNPNAPRGSDRVNLYSNGMEGGDHLTLGQLAIAVSMHAAAAYESQSVVKMNRMTSGSDTLSQCAVYLEEMSDGTEEWAEIKAYMQNTLDITDELPDDLNTYDRRMTAITALKTKMDSLARSQQEMMIDLQTLVNRRSVAFSASSNIVRALGTSMSGNASNF